MQRFWISHWRLLLRANAKTYSRIGLVPDLLEQHSDRLDYAFHRDAILELFRVSAKEVRIYPLQGPDAQPYPHMDQLLADLRRNAIASEIRPVPFEFQRGSNQMLRLIR